MEDQLRLPQQLQQRLVVTELKLQALLQQQPPQIQIMEDHQLLLLPLQIKVQDLKAQALEVYKFH